MEKRVERGRAVDLIFVDLQRAYDTVPVNKLWLCTRTVVIDIGFLCWRQSYSTTKLVSLELRNNKKDENYYLQNDRKKYSTYVAETWEISNGDKS
ncbi:hypothetical protein HUJ05_009609, partial [Dendroctonus ponderosae]